MNILSRMNYAQRQAYRESRKAEIAEQKARKQAAAMTCQCCGRQIFAQRGKIAHHGYERPGYGWQTASCMGALYLPFEVARERLGDLIVSLKGMIKDTKAAISQIEAETIKLPFEISIDCPEWTNKYGRKFKTKAELRFYSRREFEALKEKGKDGVDAYHATAASERVRGELPMAKPEAVQIYFDHRTWDDLKARAMSEQLGRLRALQGDLDMSETRHAGWKQTHTGFDKATKEWRVKG